MNTINLLKKAKQAPKPAIPKKEPAAGGTNRKKIYVFFLIAALGYFIYTYLPNIVDFIYKSPAPSIPIASAPVKRDTAKQETVAKIDTPSQPPFAQTKTTPAPQKPVEQEKPVVQPKEEKLPVQEPVRVQPSPAPQITLSEDVISISQQIAAYMALHRSLENEGKYTLLAVDGNRISSEIQNPSPEALERFNQNLRNQLPGNRLKMSSEKTNTNSPGLKTVVFGTYKSGKSEIDEKSLPAFSAEEVIKKLSRLARRNGFTLTSKEIGETIFSDDAIKTPLILKFKGSENQSLSFLAAFRRESLNCQLLKIAGMPFPGTGTNVIPDSIQVVIIMNVILPTKG